MWEFYFYFVSCTERINLQFTNWPGLWSMMIYHTEWKPTSQFHDRCEYHTIKNPAEIVDHKWCVLSYRYTSYFLKTSDATSQKIYMLNKITSKEIHNCTTHNIICVPNGTFTAEDTTDRSVGLLPCAVLFFTLWMTSHFNVYCRLLTQAYEQQADGRMDQHDHLYSLWSFPRAFSVKITLSLPMTNYCKFKPLWISYADEVVRIASSRHYS